jgi:hypothetical protein
VNYGDENNRAFKIQVKYEHVSTIQFLLAEVYVIVGKFKLSTTTADTYITNTQCIDSKLYGDLRRALCPTPNSNMDIPKSRPYGKSLDPSYLTQESLSLHQLSISASICDNSCYLPTSSTTKFLAKPRPSGTPINCTVADFPALQPIPAPATPQPDSAT